MLVPELAALAVRCGSTANDAFRPSPIEPSWILEGNPVARSLTLAQSDDRMLSCGLWDCTAGKFEYIYYCDEIVHILEGEVTVEDAGKRYELRPGDVAFFAQGLSTRWTVPHYVKKFCIFRSVEPSLARKVASRLKKVLGRS